MPPVVEMTPSHAMLLVGVLWVLPMLALALLFSDGDGLLDTGCRIAPEKEKADVIQIERNDNHHQSNASYPAFWCIFHYQFMYFFFLLEFMMETELIAEFILL